MAFYPNLVYKIIIIILSNAESKDEVQFADDFCSLT